MDRRQSHVQCYALEHRRRADEGLEPVVADIIIVLQRSDENADEILLHRRVFGTLRQKSET